MASSWKKMATAAHQDETLFLSKARQMTRLPVSVAQYNYYHNLQRSQFNRQAYKLQNDLLKSTNIRLPMKTPVYNNNSNNNINNNISKTSESDLNGDLDHHHHRHVTDDNDNNNNNNSNNNNNNNHHDEAINSTTADVSSDLSGSEKSTPPTSPVNADWRTPISGIVNGRSFASVVASSPVSMVTEGRKIDTSDDVDDGFEEESSISPNNNNNNNNIVARYKLSDSSMSSGLGNSVKVSISSLESGDGKIESETTGTTVVKNYPQQVIREIPERFKKLLKAAQDKAMAQRLRVEGVPLIRGYPQPSAGYIYPQTIPSENFGCLVHPSYPQVVPVTQTMYPQSPAYADTNSFIDSKDQKSSQNLSQDIDQLDNQINNVPSPQQNGDGYGNSIPAEQHLYVNQGNVQCLPVQTTYSPLAYYTAHQYQMVYGVVNGNNDASCCYGYNASGIYVDQQQQALYYQQQHQQQQHLYQQQNFYQNQQQQQELYVSQLQQQQTQPQHFYNQMVAH